MKKTFTIIVLFNPTKDQLKDKIENAGNNYIIFIDNSPDKDSSIERLILSYPNSTYIWMGGNKGIAAAQNRGIKEAIEQGATHFVFFDQDSEFHEAYSNIITYIYDDLRKNGIKIGILGPTVNRYDGNEYKSNFHQYGLNEFGFIEKPEIISSGSVVDKTFINDVGGLDNSLFIDLVDHEWCWRAKSKGYRIGQTPELHLSHKVGQSEFHLWKYQSIISAPFRYFYQCRNYVWLCKRKYVPMSFKVKTATHFLIHTIFYPFMVKGGIDIIKNMNKGLLYGLTHKNSPDLSIK